MSSVEIRVEPANDEPRPGADAIETGSKTSETTSSSESNSTNSSISSSSEKVVIDRPSTPPAISPTQLVPPRTPDSSKLTNRVVPRTPFETSSGSTLGVASPAAIYLSSPIRRNKTHSAMSNLGTMTPGRPVKVGGKFSLGTPSFSPFKSSRRTNQGRVSLGNTNGQELELPNMPLQFLFMTPEQVHNIEDIQTVKENLIAALEQGDAFRKAAQLFRSQASHYLFQHKLMQIENDEQEQRYEVETSIQKREVERLVVEIMGYNDKSIDTEQIRKRLKYTKHRVKEVEAQLAEKSRIIENLEYQLEQANQLNQRNISMSNSSMNHPNTVNGGAAGTRSDISEKDSGQPQSQTISDNVNTQNTSEQKANVDKLSALEVLASQVLSNGIHSDPIQPQALQYGSSPYSSPYHDQFSPFGRVQYQQASHPPPLHIPMSQFDKKRRPSSSSTILAMSEEDTLEDYNVE